MLVLTRREDETIEILCPDGAVIKVMCVEVRAGRFGGERRVKLGVTAPKAYTVHRAEVAEAIRRDAALPPCRMVAVTGSINAAPL